jgi:hypothetical protein
MRCRLPYCQQVIEVFFCRIMPPAGGKGEGSDSRTRAGFRSSLAVHAAGWRQRSGIEFGLTTGNVNRIMGLVENGKQKIREIARKSGLSPSGVSRLLRGHREPRLGTALKLAKGMGISIDELMHRLPARP